MFHLIIVMAFLQGRSPKETLNSLRINLRGAEFKRDNVLVWNKARLQREAEIRQSKTGRVYVSAGFGAYPKWIIPSKKKTKVFNKGVVIGATMSEAKGKKGGWYICLHKQKVVLSEPFAKFVFCNYWRHYWASDQMLEAGLWTCLDDKSKADFIPQDLYKGFVSQAKSLLKGEADEQEEEAW